MQITQQMLMKTFLEKKQLTKQSTGNHLLQQVDVATPKPLSERFPKILRHMRCHIHTNFVSKGGNSHRQTSFSGQLVQLFWRHTLLMKKKDNNKKHVYRQVGQRAAALYINANAFPWWAAQAVHLHHG